MPLLEFLKNRFRTRPVNLGAIVDTRQPEEKANDLHISELVASSAAVDWKELPPQSVRSFPVQNQGSKSSCVAESRRKLLRIIFFVNRGLDLDFSSVDLYRRRANYPEPGMQATDAIQLTENVGMTLDALVPSDLVDTEEKANAHIIKPHDTEVAKVFRTSREVTFTPGDVNTPAGTIQKSRKGIMAWYYFTFQEWAREVPEIQDDALSLHGAQTIRHSIVLVEPAIYRGQRGFWIEDTAHFGGFSRRFITEAFHVKRNFWLSYPITLRFDDTGPTRPSFDGSTKSLQDCLRHVGFFPSNVDSTGFFGTLTREAVKRYQQSKGLQQVGTVGPLTLRALSIDFP